MSKTSITRFKRKLRKKNMGTDRKAQLRIHGTTPKFDVRSAAAVANAPAEQLTASERAELGK